MQPSVCALIGLHVAKRNSRSTFFLLFYLFFLQMPPARIPTGWVRPRKPTAGSVPKTALQVDWWKIMEEKKLQGRQVCTYLPTVPLQFDSQPETLWATFNSGFPTVVANGTCIHMWLIPPGLLLQSTNGRPKIAGLIPPPLHSTKPLFSEQASRELLQRRGEGAALFSRTNELSY